jgi:hypothetical protein
MTGYAAGRTNREMANFSNICCNTVKNFAQENNNFIEERTKISVFTSVADPDPDPHVFGPPGSGSGSTIQRYGSGSGSCSGSGSFYHHAKIVRKTLIPTIL